MRKPIVVLLAGSLLANTGWTDEKTHAHKEHSQKEESIGLGSGAAIGAIAGGPVGLIIGAAFGGWLGDRFHHERSERAAAEQRAGDAQANSSSLERRLSGTEQQLASSEAQLQSERVAHREGLEHALALEVYFRTEDSAVTDADEQRLTELASLIAPLDGAVIRLDGRADVRGTRKYNDVLSAARATSVRDALVRAGMPAERIVVTAAGETESAAAEQDADGMALDRRVRVSVVGLDDASRVAQQTQ
jgi:outer membrane protein OmpA-like peptidoglycan-associated protein